jgi:hypothetical protein
MKDLSENLKKIYTGEKPLLVLMAILLVTSIALLIFSIVNLKPGATVVKVGYGDIGRYQGGEWSSMANSGGYYDASWTEMLAFPALALIFGLLHNLLAVKLYSKKGTGVAQVFVIYSICLALATFVVLTRLLGEG